MEDTTAIDPVLYGPRFEIPPLPEGEAEVDPVGQNALNLALYKACGSGTAHVVPPNPARFRHLLELGADPIETEGPRLRGWRVLHRAAHNGSMEIVTMLVEELGIDFQKRTPWGGDALLYAALRDHLDVALFLISKGANPNIDCSNGRTAISHYGTFAVPHPGADAVLARSQILASAFLRGPHPDACWQRRWPLFSVLTGHGILPSLSHMQIEMNRQGEGEGGDGEQESQDPLGSDAWTHCLCWCWRPLTAVHPGIKDVIKQRRLLAATLGVRDILQQIVQYL